MPSAANPGMVTPRLPPGLTSPCGGCVGDKEQEVTEQDVWSVAAPHGVGLKGLSHASAGVGVPLSEKHK